MLIHAFNITQIREMQSTPGHRFESKSLQEINRILKKEAIVREIAKLGECDSVETLRDRVSDILATIVSMQP